MTKTWQDIYKSSLSSSSDLVREGLIKPEDGSAFESVRHGLDFRVPAEFLSEIKGGEPGLVRQFVPSLEELAVQAAERRDPIGDEAHSPTPGITHRYADRVLLKLTYLCASYCRYCFRRYKVSQAQHNLRERQIELGLRYIESHPEIWEVILTGGDPLVLSNPRLNSIFQKLSAIPHVKVIRIHTRLPSVLPERIDDELCRILQPAGKSVWVAVHINSPAEFKDPALSALRRLALSGIGLVSQSVLLKGVNDDFKTLVALLRRFVEAGVKPYYLHYPDLALGTNHFRIPLKEAIALVGGLRGKISGLCIPQLIVDIPGGYGKVVVDVERARAISDSEWEFISPLSGETVYVVYP